MWVIEDVIARHVFNMSRNDKEGSVGKNVGEKDKYKDLSINEGIIRQRVWATEDVIAALAEGRLAMTGGKKSYHRDKDR